MIIVCGAVGVAGQLRRGGAGAAWAGGRERGSVVPGGRPAGHSGGRGGAAGRSPEGSWAGEFGKAEFVCFKTSCASRCFIGIFFCLQELEREREEKRKLESLVCSLMKDVERLREVKQERKGELDVTSEKFSCNR